MTKKGKKKNSVNVCRNDDQRQDPGTILGAQKLDKAGQYDGSILGGLILFDDKDAGYAQKSVEVIKLDLSLHVMMSSHFGNLPLLQTVMEFDKEMDIFLSRLRQLRRIDAYTWAENLYHVYST